MKPSQIAQVGIGLIVAHAQIACGSQVGPTVGPPDAIAAGAQSSVRRSEATAPDPRVEALLGMIETDPDPSYVYAFDRPRFVPPAGKTLLILGQDLGAIDAHVESFPAQPVPGGWAAYWGIPSMGGVDTEATNDTGSTHHHQALVDRFPNTVLQSGLWMVGNWGVARRTAKGEFDGVIRSFSRWVKDVKRPIYLRIGYEFDGPHNELDPTEYVDAYRRIVDVMRGEGVENVAYVWHSYGAPPYQGFPISAWYPGDDYVDWVSVSLFGQLYRSGPDRYVDAVFDFAREKRKPVMIGESSPIHGVGAADTEAWERWFARLFSLGYARNIKAVSIINDNWRRFRLPGIDWADARLQNNRLVSEAFFAETNKDRYLKQSPTLFEDLGYTP